MTNINKVSRLFQPLNIVPKNAEVKNQDITSISQKLMLDFGIIRQANPGCFHLLPLGIRALEKLLHIVKEEMSRIGAQRIEIPMLTNSELWKTTGRLKKMSNELFTLTDRHSQSYVLNPTYEEAITDLLASVAPVSYKKLPLRLYQISSKFRDEIKPRYGLMRSRQFDMKDLYTFDVSKEAAMETYSEVNESYDRIFNELGLHFLKVDGAVGDIGGSLSHEYHLPASIGEDNLLQCSVCGFTSNAELCQEQSSCPKCDNNTEMNSQTGIEVAHTFLLGNRYSAPLKATYLSNKGKPGFLEMGCYGLGITRILAASLEVLSTTRELRWPLKIAPFKVVIIPPKDGSKEQSLTDGLAIKLYQSLNVIDVLANDVLLDDRCSMTIGKRSLEARKMGYPFIIIIGNHAVNSPPLYEIYDVSLTKELLLTDSDAINYITEIIRK